MKEMLNRMLAEHTGQDYDRIATDTDRDFFMSAGAAKEYGLIDEVVTANKATEAKGDKKD